MGREKWDRDFVFFKGRNFLLDYCTKLLHGILNILTIVRTCCMFLSRLGFFKKHSAILCPPVPIYPPFHPTNPTLPYIFSFFEWSRDWGIIRYSCTEYWIAVNESSTSASLVKVWTIKFEENLCENQEITIFYMPVCGPCEVCQFITNMKHHKKKWKLISLR